MKISVIFSQKISSGGGYQESLNSILRFIDSCPKNIEISIINISNNPIKELEKLHIEIINIRFSLFTRLRVFFRHSILNFTSNIFPGNVRFVNIVKKVIGETNCFERILEKYKVDLVYFLSPESIAFYLEKYNYIMTVWDLGFLSFNYLPELRESFAFNTRDYYYRNVLKRAYCCIVDSEFTKEKIINNYNLSREKIFEVPFSPSFMLKEFKNQVKINKSQKPYLLYPAQYSKHKNHIYLIEGIKKLRKDFNLDLELIFTGSDQGFLNELKTIAKKLKVYDLIKFFNFVSYKDLSNYYANASALIMPSFIGPTNIPPLEAMEFNIPVIYPNNKENKEYFGESFYYCDLNDVENLCLIIIDILKKPKLPKGYYDITLNKIKSKSEYSKFINYCQNFNKIAKLNNSKLIN